MKENRPFSTYAAEAEERWGSTEAWKQSAERTAGYSAERQEQLAAAMDRLMAGFARCRAAGSPPESSEACALVREWQAFISENYYTCTDEILAGLGAMYVCDPRFTENIDRHGEGTALFMSEAIKAYCG